MSTPEDDEAWKDSDPEEEPMGFPIKLPAGLANMIKAHAQRERDHEEAIDKVSGEQSERAENEILMTLWADLGDHSETYWEAMSAITLFTKISEDIKCEPLKTNMRPQVAIRLMEAWAQVALHGAETIRKVSAAHEEFKKAHEAAQEP